MQLTTTTVPVGDIDIACTVLGDGPPLVVLHGAIGLGSAYMRSLDPWADEVRLVHYDQRGSGHTPVGDVRRISFAGGVEDLEGLRRGLGLERVAVLGHSAGAYLAALYAAEHPDETSALVLLNPGPPLAPDLMQQFGAAMAAKRTPADEDARRAIEESPASRTASPLPSSGTSSTRSCPSSTTVPRWSRWTWASPRSLRPTCRKRPDAWSAASGSSTPCAVRRDPLRDPRRALGARPDPGRVEQDARRHHPRRGAGHDRGWEPLPDGRGSCSAQEHGSSLVAASHVWFVIRGVPQQATHRGGVMPPSRQAGVAGHPSG